MAFQDIVLDTGIRYGVSGGAEFNTSVITVDSGFEQRNSNWLDARGNWNLAEDIFTKKELDELIKFFRARKGKFEGFRFKDWNDYQVIISNSLLEVTETAGVYQLAKKYTSGTSVDVKQIFKPVIGTVKVYSNNGTTLLVSGVDYTIDYSKGWITMTVVGALSAIKWEGEFHIPVRFDIDKFSASFDAYREQDGEALYTVASLPIIEIRFNPLTNT